MTVADPEQALIGGLVVAIIVANGSNAAQVRAMKESLEEMGANVLVIADRRGPFAPGEHGAVQAQQRIPLVDADAFDGAIIVGDGDGGSQLAHRADLQVFLSRMASQRKPLVAVAVPEMPVPGVHAIADGKPLDDMMAELKLRLADRRRAALGMGNDLPRAVGEDG